jgi:hypothetical protein
MTFKLTPTANPTKLASHPTSQILVTHGKIVKLSLRAVHVADLQESYESEKSSTGNRELLIYAKIYKNGDFLRYEKITDIAEHMMSYQPVVVQRDDWFAEPITGNYHIQLKIYEVDTKNLVKFLRRVHNTDMHALEPYFAPGDTFMAGVKQIINGVFDVVLSMTGRSLDDWAAKIGADKAFEHSIYINPRSSDYQATPALTDPGQQFAVIGSGETNLFVSPSSTVPSDIDTAVKAQIGRLEGLTFTLDDLKNGKVAELHKAPYLVIAVDVK